MSVGMASPTRIAQREAINWGRGTWRVTRPHSVIWKIPRTSFRPGSFFRVGRTAGKPASGNPGRANEGSQSGKEHRKYATDTMDWVRGHAGRTDRTVRRYK